MQMSIQYFFAIVAAAVVILAAAYFAYPMIASSTAPPESPSAGPSGMFLGIDTDWITESVSQPKPAPASQPGISSGEDLSKAAEFDIVRATITKDGSNIIFTQEVNGAAGNKKPSKAGSLEGASVYSYVWPTSLDSSVPGFGSVGGILAFAVTSHPDFDDTPLYDENGDGNKSNDGERWHSHWVVLVPDKACGEGMLKVKNIPEGSTPNLPSTWPELPLYILSPGYAPSLSGSTVKVSVPAADIGAPKSFSYDGITAGLKVSGDLHDPMLCVTDVFDIASKNFDFPGSYTG